MVLHEHRLDRNDDTAFFKADAYWMRSSNYIRHFPAIFLFSHSYSLPDDNDLLTG